MLVVYTSNMVIYPKKKKTKSGKEYYELWDVRRVNGKVVAKYKGYIGKTPNAKAEISGKDLYPYIERLLKIGITDDQLRDILFMMGIKVDVWPIVKIIIEHDRKLGKITVKLK